MKLVLISAITASAFLTSLAPTLAQSITSEGAIKGALPDENAPIAVQERAAAPVIRAPGVVTAPAVVRGRPFDQLIATHAASNGVPAELIHRVVLRESRYRANATGRGGTSGLMQIKLATARSMGYTGSAAGLLDPDTNLTYGVRYLAGAYRAAGGHHGRAVGYYASGYRGATRPASAYARMRPEPTVFTTASSGEPEAATSRNVQRKRR